MSTTKVPSSFPAIGNNLPVYTVQFVFLPHLFPSTCQLVWSLPQWIRQNRNLIPVIWRASLCLSCFGTDAKFTNSPALKCQNDLLKEGDQVIHECILTVAMGMFSSWELDQTKPLRLSLATSLQIHRESETLLLALLLQLTVCPGKARREWWCHTSLMSKWCSRRGPSEGLSIRQFLLWP